MEGRQEGHDIRKVQAGGMEYKLREGRRDIIYVEGRLEVGNIS